LAAGALALAAAAIPGAARAAWGPDGEWATTFEISIGGGRDQISPDLRATGVAAGFALLVRRGHLTAGAHLEAAGGDRTDSTYLGLAAGGSFDLATWAVATAVLEAGSHRAHVESTFAGLPGATTHIPYMGLRLGVLALSDVNQAPALLWASRAGVGLRVNLRIDLGRETVTLPPSSGSTAPPEVFQVGGYHLSLVLVVPLVW